jgi:hypothetical protein
MRPSPSWIRSTIFWPKQAREWRGWQNLILPKVRRQLEYNRDITRRIGPRWLWFLRAVLHEGRPFDAATLLHLRQLLEVVAKKPG